MQVGNGLKAILHGVKFHQGHVLLIRVAQDLHRLHLPVLAEYLVQRALLADLLLQRRDMQGLRGGVDCQRTVRRESE